MDANDIPWVVLKYGGTSVSTLATWQAIAERARQVLKEGCQVWITVSAITQITNKLIAALAENGPRDAYKWIVQRHLELGNALNLTSEEMAPVLSLMSELERLLEGVQLTGEATPRLRARVLAMGELSSSHIGRAYLSRMLLTEARVSRVDARELLFATDRAVEHDETRFLEADVTPREARAEAFAKLKQLPLDDGELSVRRVVITQGFIASTASGQTCLLGRGGSDTSGALFAALLKAKRCEIWTDVYGLFTCDPRLLPEARLIREMSYREAQELAAMGAKVLHPRCLGPAQWASVPVEVRNTMDPQGSERGILTRVCSNPDEGAAAGKPRVVAVTKRTDQILLTVQNFDMWGATGFLSRVFSPFGTMGIGVDLIATSEYSVSMTLDNVPGGFRGPVLARLVAELRALVPKGAVTVEERCAVVSIVGRRLRHALPSLAKALREMRGYDVRLMSQSAEDLNLSFVVSDQASIPGYVDALVTKLHHALFDVVPMNKHQQLQEEPAQVDEDASLGASWDELRAGGPTPRPIVVAPPSVNNNLSMPNRNISTSPTTSKSSSVAEWRSQLSKLILSPVGVVIDIDALSKFTFPSGLRMMVGDFKGSQHPAALRALSRAGVGFECTNMHQVVECYSLGDSASAVVAFAPNYAASEDEYARAVALGCSELVADDEHALEMLRLSPKCWSAKLFTRTDDNGFVLCPTGRNVRSLRWASLLMSSENSRRIVSSGAIISQAVAYVTVVSRVTGKVVQISQGPSQELVEACGLQIMNISKLNGKVTEGEKTCYGVGVADDTKVGDKLVFFASANQEANVVWW